ncbi:Bgt-4264 [Blumeria graminis f. sp. tritici]|uniref:Bgt-4264 n=2 Tax=Blumeria graminis f. sp. tritici TaxID=62690 RepID=A0A9X9MH94_BLUGR|nr:Bgt-4264 [Blumeria graminis f. sp. tritici]
MFTWQEDNEASESQPPVTKKPKSSISGEKISTYLSQSPEKLTHYESPGSASDSEDPLSSLFPSKYFSSISTLVFKLPKPCFSAQTTLSTACSSLSLRKTNRIVESSINSLDESEHLDELSRPESFILTDSRSSAPDSYYQEFDRSEKMTKLRSCSPSVNGNMNELRTENPDQFPGPENFIFTDSRSSAPESYHLAFERSEKNTKLRSCSPSVNGNMNELRTENPDQFPGPENFIFTDSRSSAPESYHRAFERSEKKTKLRSCSPSVNGNMNELRTENPDQFPGPENFIFTDSRSSAPESYHRAFERSEKNTKLRSCSPSVNGNMNELRTENPDQFPGPENFIFTDSRSSAPESYHLAFERSEKMTKLRSCSPSVNGNINELRTRNLDESLEPEQFVLINSKSAVSEESHQGPKKSERRLKSRTYMPILNRDLVELQAKKKSSSRFHHHLDVPVPEPVYYPFKCEWQGCPAELMNMEILRKHVYMLHSAKLESGGRRCLWKKCGQAWEAAVTAKDEDIKSPHGHYPNDNETTYLRQTFYTRKQWKQHIEECHLIPFSWHMGDGPRGSQLAKQSTIWHQPYLYNANGFQITPSVAAQPIEEGRACKLNARRFQWQSGKGIFGEEILVPIIDCADNALK